MNGDLTWALEALHFAFRSIVAEPDRILAAQGLGRAHHRILFFIARRPGLPIAQLVATLGISRQALHRPLRELTAKGYVATTPDPANRRASLLTLSRKGTAFEAKLSGLQRQAFHDAFQQAGPAATQGWRHVMDLLGQPLSSRQT